MFTITIQPKKSKNANSIQRLRNDGNEITYTEGELKDGLKRLDNALSKQKTRIEEMKKESTIDTPELNRRIRAEEDFLDAMEATKKDLKEDLKALTQAQKKKKKDDRVMKRKKELKEKKKKKKKKKKGVKRNRIDELEETIEDPRGVPPARGWMWSDKRQKWVIPKNY